MFYKKKIQLIMKDCFKKKALLRYTEKKNILKGLQNIITVKKFCKL